jgi:hypothetical protein
MQDHSSAQKSHAGQDSLDDAADCVLVGNTQSSLGRPEHNNGGDGCAEADQGMSPHAGWFPVQLAIQPEKAPEQEGRAQAQGGFFISAHDHARD